MNLHAQIMNLPFSTPADVAWTVGETQAAKIGHRDARHAAAELASAQEAEIDALRKDAERYRWLRDKGSNTWVPFTGQWKMDAEHCDAAIDNEMANQRLFGAA